MQIVSSEQHSLTSDYQKLFGREVHETLDLQVNGQRLQMQRHERVLVAEQGSAGLLSRTAEPLMSLQALKHLAAEQAIQQKATVARQDPPANIVEEYAPKDADLEKLRVLLEALARLNGDLDSFFKYKTAPVLEPSSVQLVSPTPVVEQVTAQLLMAI